jgi:hypothetical protein
MYFCEMKKLFLSIISLVTLSIQAQDTVSVNDIYQIPSENVLSQFVVDLPNMTSSDIKSMVEKWSTQTFANPNAVTLANNSESVVFEPILVSSYSGAMGVLSEIKVTCNTLIEFKDGKMRVTIVERPSTYVSSSGVVRKIMKDNFTMGIKQFKSKGFYAANYRMLIEGKRLVDNYVTDLKNIQTTSFKTNNW